jgi:hypothetical protein
MSQMAKESFTTKEGSEKTVLRNTDEADIGQYNRKMGLQFESRFESGNLRKAIQVKMEFYFQISFMSLKTSFQLGLLLLTGWRQRVRSHNHVRR